MCCRRSKTNNYWLEMLLHVQKKMLSPTYCSLMRTVRRWFCCSGCFSTWKTWSLIRPMNLALRSLIHALITTHQAPSRSPDIPPCPSKHAIQPSPGPSPPPPPLFSGQHESLKERTHSGPSQRNRLPTSELSANEWGFVCGGMRSISPIWHRSCRH